MSRRVLAVCAALAAVAATFVPMASASSAPATNSGDYCVVHVTGQKPSGELTTSSPQCYATLDDAMTAEGVAASGADASLNAPQGATFQIGLHCDQYGLGAPCMSVVGTSCSGGWVNTSAFWDNKISSTLSGCPFINHFDLPNLGGGVLTTSGAGPFNLISFDNRTESLQYF